MIISEIFGHGVDSHSKQAWDDRKHKHCPFRNSKCTKSSKTDPIGVCSLSDGKEAAALCPVRFLERDRIFQDAARLAFDDVSEIGVFPEIRILKIEAEDKSEKDRKIGKVDFLIAKIKNNTVIDFAAVEVQAVYFSGGEIRSALKHYITHKELDLSKSERRPDFRSSAQKRLVPQLQLKVPVFRRWGKKFFVVVDTQFFGALPGFKSTTRANSELTWLCYPLAKHVASYSIGEPNVIYSEWDEVRNSLREGVPPEPSEIIAELQGKLDGPAGKGPRLIDLKHPSAPPL